MLNYNKIESILNFHKNGRRELSEYLKMPQSTFYDKLKKKNLTPDDVYGIAQYFNKPIGYFFDESEAYAIAGGNPDISEDIKITPYNCMECINKEKKLNEQDQKIKDLQDELLELYRAKKAN